MNEVEFSISTSINVFSLSTAINALTLVGAGFPRDDLPDGVYTFPALQNRGVNIDAPPPKGQLQGWKGPEAALKRARASGADYSRIFWR